MKFTFFPPGFFVTIPSVMKIWSTGAGGVKGSWVWLSLVSLDLVDNLRARLVGRGSGWASS